MTSSFQGTARRNIPHCLREDFQEWLFFASPVCCADGLAVFIEQRLQTPHNFSNDLFRDSTDSGGLPRPPVQALHLIRPHHTRYAQSRRQRHFEGIAFHLIGDRTDDGQSGSAIVFQWSQHQRRPPIRLLVSGLGAEVNPDEVSAVRDIWRRKFLPRFLSNRLAPIRFVVTVVWSDFVHQLLEVVFAAHRSDDKAVGRHLQFNLSAFGQSERFRERRGNPQRQAITPFGHALHSLVYTMYLRSVQARARAAA